MSFLKKKRIKNFLKRRKKMNTIIFVIIIALIHLSVSQGIMNTDFQEKPVFAKYTTTKLYFSVF